MPKTFSDSERAYIKARLMEEAKKCLALYGIRKTTVDELVNRVNIPKGTFYLFYESKEHLIFDVILQFNDETQQRMIAEVSTLKDDLDQEKLTDVIFGLYQTLGDSFLPKLIGNGELDFYMRKLPAELSQTHAEHDDRMVERLVALLPERNMADAKVFSAAMRGIFLSLLHKQDIGADVFDDALRVMIRGIVIQMFEGERKMISVKELSFSYTKKPFIENTSFEVKSGEIFGFLGPSGAGKSTLQKILTGLLTSYTGSVVVNGEEVARHNKRFCENIGVDFEFPSLYEKLTARENLRFFASLYQKHRGNRLAAFLGWAFA
jgi:ABC-type multidrug transport system fused ATPase/permease subunit